MNILPVGPHLVEDTDSRSRYFADLDGLGFDIACSSVVGLSYESIVNNYKGCFVEFAAEARRRGYPSCIELPSTMCTGDRLGFKEAQHDASNNPVKWGEKGFQASFASEEWKDYLKELVTLFVNELGYQYVLFQSPAYYVDIPGSEDPFHSWFMEANPDVRYPSERKENSEYLKIQQAKARLLVSFHEELAAHAKSLGAKKVGVGRGAFLPTAVGSSEEASNSCCDAGVLAALTDVDFLVGSLCPADVASGAVRVAGETLRSPEVIYSEVMAQSLGKDLIACGSPVSAAKQDLVPEEFLRDALAASLAAMPCGVAGGAYGPWVGGASTQTELLARAGGYAGKMGRPISPVAFVFSCSGTRHVSPYNYESVYGFYWALTKKMLFDAHIPMLTFHAETLDRDLAAHPEVQVLVFDEHFPLTVEQMMVIRGWWQGSQRRSAVAFGLGKGFSADVNSPGLQPSAQAFPGIMELIGLKQDEDLQVIFDEPVSLIDVSRVRRSAFLGEDLPPVIGKVAGVKRVFGSRANVLYEVEQAGSRVPVVSEWRDRSTLAMFCGFGLSDETADMAIKAIRYAIREVDALPLMMDSCSDGVVWNMNSNSYLVLANLSDKEGSAVGRPGRAHFWDCMEQKQLPDGDPKITLAPHSYRVFRVVGRRSKFLDIIGASCLRELMDGAGRAEIGLLAGRKTVLVLRNSPKEIHVDGKPCTITQEVVDGIYYVTLQQCPHGERKISLRW